MCKCDFLGVVVPLFWDYVEVIRIPASGSVFNEPDRLPGMTIGSSKFSIRGCVITESYVVPLYISMAFHRFTAGIYLGSNSGRLMSLYPT